MNNNKTANFLKTKKKEKNKEVRMKILYERLIFVLKFFFIYIWINPTTETNYSDQRDRDG